MTNKITETITPVETTNLVDMIPVFIGQTQKLFVMDTPFTNLHRNYFNIPTEQGFVLDKTSIKIENKYWDELLGPVSLTGDSQGKNTFEYNTEIPDGLDLTCMFIVMDSNGEMVFSSKIKTINKDLAQLISITLEDKCYLEGNVRCSICKIFSIMPVILIEDNIQLLYEDILYTAPGVAGVIKSITTYKMNQLDFEVRDAVTNDSEFEGNFAIKIGIRSAKNCKVINYNNESQIGMLLDTLDGLYVQGGYYFVPIGLDEPTVNQINNFVKTKEKANNYFALLTPLKENIQQTILLEDQVWNNAYYTIEVTPDLQVAQFNENGNMTNGPMTFTININRFNGYSKQVSLQLPRIQSNFDGITILYNGDRINGRTPILENVPDTALFTVASTAQGYFNWVNVMIESTDEIPVLSNTFSMY